MFLSTLTLALCSTLPIQEPAAPPTADYTGLMPTDAMVVVRYESLDSLLESITAISATIEPDAPLPQKEDFVRGPFSGQFDPKGVDSSRPVYLGWNIRMDGTRLTAVLPASDLELLEESVVQSRLTYEVRGDWIGVTNGETYNPTNTNAVLEGMFDGVVSAHVDSKALMETFGAMAMLGMAQARQQIMDQMDAMPSPMDMEAIFDLYFDGIELFLTCSESLDIALIDHGEQLTLHGSYRAKEGSALAGLTESMPLPATLPVAVPADTQLSYVTVAKADQLFHNFAPLIDSVIDIYPESVRENLRNYMLHVPDLYKGIGDTAVYFGDFAPSGMTLDYYCDYSDEHNFEDALRKFMTQCDGSAKALGVTFQDPIQIELGDVKATQFPITFDYDKLTALWLESLGTSMDAEALIGWTKTIYGENPTITVAQYKGRLWGSMGSTGDDLLKAASRLQAGPVPAASTFAAMPGLPSSVHPLLSYRVDFGAIMGNFQPMLQSAGFDFEFPDSPLNLSTWMGVNGRDWIGGMTFSPKEIKPMIDALTQRETETVIQAEFGPAPK